MINKYVNSYNLHIYPKHAKFALYEINLKIFRYDIG